MSVLIKDMEMPKYCYDCPCHNVDAGYCQAGKDRLYSEFRPAKCPLEEIKETKLEIVEFGKGGLVLLRCVACGHEGWFSTMHPKFCVNCGAKFKEK